MLSRVSRKDLNRRKYAMKYLRDHGHETFGRRRVVYLKEGEFTSVEKKWIEYLVGQGYCVMRPIR